MKFRKLLQDYELIEGIYLRKDGKAVASISTDESIIGFLMIAPQSKKRFSGKGVVFEEDLESKIPYLYKFLESGSNDGLLSITENQIKEFINSDFEGKNKPHDYLHEFSTMPCRAYAMGAIGNRIRSVIATANLKYSPFKYNQRMKLNEEFKRQMLEEIGDLMANKSKKEIGTLFTNLRMKLTAIVEPRYIIGNIFKGYFKDGQEFFHYRTEHK